MVWDQTAAGFGQANWEAGSQVNSERARLSNFDWTKMSHSDTFGYYKMRHFIPYPRDTHCARKFDFILKLCYTKMGWTRLLGFKKNLTHAGAQ